MMKHVVSTIVAVAFLFPAILASTDMPSESSLPSTVPSIQPSREPSSQPSITPSLRPSKSPSSLPSHSPSLTPSDVPSHSPSLVPSDVPSYQPSRTPSQEPTTSPTGTCPDPLIPVTRTYFFSYSGIVSDGQLISVFREAYGKLPKHACSPVLTSLEVTAQRGDGSTPRQPHLTSVSLLDEPHHHHHRRRLQAQQVNVQVKSDQIAEGSIFESPAQEAAFIAFFNAGLGSATLGSIAHSAVPSSAPSDVPSTAPSRAPSTAAPSAAPPRGNCCPTKAWGDHLGRRRCPVHNPNCACPGANCCTVCPSTLGGRMLEEEEAQEFPQADSTEEDICSEQHKCVTDDGLPGFLVHDKVIKSYLKRRGKQCLSYCAPMEAAVDMVASGSSSCGACDDQRSS